MRVYPSVVAFSALLLLRPSPVAAAQSALALPGCEAAPQVRKLMDDKLDSDKLDKMKAAERWAFQRKTLEDLIAQYPRELMPYESLWNQMQFRSPGELPAERERRVKMATDHPDDPLALLLAGEALENRDTPEAIRLLEAAKSKAPQFAWPSLQLARIYFSGKRADKARVDENLEAFFAVCPASTNGPAQFYLNKDQPLQPKVAAALRARLEKETDPKILEDYETLWGLEFRNRPPAQHDAERAQVAADLKRLEALQPIGDAAWQAFLIGGYKQSGASKETVTAKEDRLLHDYPHSNEAYSIVYDRWDKSHPKPEDEADAAGWAKYTHQYEEALKGWIRDFPDNSYLRQYAWFFAIDDDDSITQKDGIAAVDAYLKAGEDYEPPASVYWIYENAADFLLDRHWQPQRALALLEKVRTPLEQNNARVLQNDNASDEQRKETASQQLYEDQNLTGLVLKAALQTRNAEPALQLKAQIEAPAPSEKKRLSAYWWNRARLEMLEGHKQDALAYYQLALHTRLSPPKPWHGKLEDDLTGEAQDLWKAQGGSQSAWAVWSKPPAGSETQQAEGRWEKPTKAIPQFELSDLSGKTWRLKDLNGKTLVINLWATWCGPCMAELPHFEKFYEKNKDRADMQILTFDIDEDLGLVEPFMKEKGYTFPVLPAYSTVVSLLDGFAIPQTWLVDPKGAWRWKQIGYGGGSDADFEKDMLTRVDSTRMSE